MHSGWKKCPEKRLYELLYDLELSQSLLIALKTSYLLVKLVWKSQLTTGTDSLKKPINISKS